MRHWDEAASQHLAELLAAFEATGFFDVARDNVVVTFRTNLDRHEPEELFDDSGTLGFLSSKNLINRLSSVLRASGSGPLEGIEASMNNNTLEVIHSGVTLHIIKAPASPRREPNWGAFRWDRPTREAAATRNSKSYRAPHTEALIEPLFAASDLVVDELEGCAEVFLVWSGDETTGLTAAWLGLPTTAPDSWLAVAPLWWDEPEAPKNSVNTPVDPAGPSDGFLSRQPASPIIGLKRDRASGTDS